MSHMLAYARADSRRCCASLSRLPRSPLLLASLSRLAPSPLSLASLSRLPRSPPSLSFLSRLPRSPPSLASLARLPRSPPSLASLSRLPRASPRGRRAREASRVRPGRRATILFRWCALICLDLPNRRLGHAHVCRQHSSLSLKSRYLSSVSPTRHVCRQRHTWRCLPA